jgi:putative nucleotidyltransferase with HDIG domain
VGGAPRKLRRTSGVGASSKSGRGPVPVVPAVLGTLLLVDVVAIGLLARASDWDAPLLVAGLVAAVLVAERVDVRAPSGMRLDGSLPVVVLAATLAGALPGALVAVLACVGERKALRFVVADLAIYVALAAGAAGLLRLGDVDSGSGWAVPWIALTFLVVAGMSFVLVAAFNRLTLDRPFAAQLRESYVPLIGMHAIQGVVIGAVAVVYVRHELPALLVALILIAGYLKLQTDLIRARHLEVAALERAERLARTQFGIVRALLDSVEQRDRMTARHSAAVARYCLLMAEAAGLPQATRETVHTAALLHDLGKFTFPDDIFWTAKLSDRELEIVKGHPAAGADIVRRLDGHEHIAEVVLCHHERWDGGGYPRGLAGEAIPVEARMIAIADTYDVLVSRDSYRPPVEPAEAIAELRRVAGHQLDPELVPVFVDRVLAGGAAFEHLDDADFEAELALEGRIKAMAAGAPAGAPAAGLHG